MESSRSTLDNTRTQQQQELNQSAGVRLPPLYHHHHHQTNPTHTLTVVDKIRDTRNRSNLLLITAKWQLILCLRMQCFLQTDTPSRLPMPRWQQDGSSDVCPTIY